MSRHTLTLLFLLTWVSTGVAEDKRQWSQWRGPGRTGISQETGLLKRWGTDGPPILWQANGLGSGYSSVVVTEDKVLTMGRRKGGEFLIALSAQDGKELWATRVGNGGHSNCTPTVSGDLVVALGLKGDLVGVNMKDGSVRWRKSFSDDFGGKMMSVWGFSESPLIDGKRVICTPGGDNAMMAALDADTGEVLWQTPRPAELGNRGKFGAGYSSIVISHAAGVKQYVQLTGKGVISVDAGTGKLLWHYNRIANGVANIPTPLVKGDYVFCSSGYGTGAALVEVHKDGDALRAEEKYFLDARTMQNHHGGMILLGDHVYCGHGHNKGFPLCIELKTGKVAWRGGRGPGSGSAAIAYADGHLYFRYQDATMALIEAQPNSYQLKGKFKIASKHRESWPHPVIAGGRLYLRDQHQLHCYNIKQK